MENAPMTDDNPATWRDIADQLTPDQIAELIALRDETTPENLLRLARNKAAENMAATVLGLRPPADAVTVDPWENDGTGNWSRHFTGPTRNVGPATVVVHGDQLSDGTVARSLYVRSSDGGDGIELTPAQARELMSVLGASADHVNAANSADSQG
jgi:hypothetical protein